MHGKQRAIRSCGCAVACDGLDCRRNLADFTYVGNFVHGMLLAAERLEPQAPCNGKAYFVTNDDRVYFWSFISSVGERGSGWCRHR